MKLHIATIPREALEAGPKESYYARQKKLFVLLVIAVSLAPLLVISWTSSHFYQQSWQKQTSLSLASLAENRKEVIGRYLANQENVLAGLVELYPLRELGTQEKLEKVFAAINHGSDMADLGVIDRNGRHLAYVGPFRQQLLDKNYEKSEWFREVMKEGRYISDVFEGFRGVPHFVVAVAAPDKSWVLRATVNSNLFNALLESAEVGPGGDAFIMNVKGELQTPSRLGVNTLSPSEYKAIVEGDTKEVLPGQNALYATSWVKNDEWLLVLKTDIHTSLAEFYRARNRDFLIIACATLIILAVSTLLVRSMVNQIEKANRQRLDLMNRVRQAEKMALVGRLAAGVAHEINNPLQIIGDQAGWILELLDDDPERQPENLQEYRTATGKIREQVKRASVITHRLLGFSRKESGLAEVDMNQALEESLSFVESEARRHRIVIKKVLAEDIGPIQSNGSQLQEVFLNILNNAMDAIGEDGEIAITTGKTENRIAIEFADNGPGMPEEVRGRIFDPFYTTKAKGKGTGLGLSISYSIMQRLGGDIQVRNRRRGGCVFTVIVPAINVRRKGMAPKAVSQEGE